MPKQLKPAHRVIVNGTTMVQGAGHLDKRQIDRWKAIYRKINPSAHISTENHYR